MRLFASVAHAVNRRDRQGALIAPEQALTRQEALDCATRGGAALTFDEDRKGSLIPGQLADLAVLDADPLGCDADHLAGIGADITIVDGRIVQRSDTP